MANNIRYIGGGAAATGPLNGYFYSRFIIRNSAGFLLIRCRKPPQRIILNYLESYNVLVPGNYQEYLTSQYFSKGDQCHP